jgi:multidrug efflux pump subunit AcrB
MDIARYFIKNTTSSWLVVLILLVGGISSFLEIGKLEDPAFTIKQAVITVGYPGASPLQVEEEVTLAVEQAIQQLPYLDNVKSISSPGLALIEVNIKSEYRSEKIPQIWDELRRRVQDAQALFPPGALTPRVSDDFGDVFGILLSVTGKDFSQAELIDFTKYLKRELITINGVSKVDVQGAKNKVIVLEISNAKLATLGISQKVIISTINAQNFISHAGSIRIGKERIRFSPSGEFQTIAELKNLVLSNPNSNNIMRLGDIANIYQDYEDISRNLIRFNGQNSLLAGISFVPGVNVVEVGHKIDQKLKQIESFKPTGIDIDYVYNQPSEVTTSIDAFLLNLVSAVVIVVFVLFFSMGWRSGTIIGIVLVVTVMGTLIFMFQMGIQLQRISLGAIVIALGMLVDNAIVVTDGIISGVKKKHSLVDAASLIVKQTKWPLLGATVIAITAFAPIGLSPDDTGEFAGSLFWVILISLLLSWVTAITITPFFASLFLKESSEYSPEEVVTKKGFFHKFLMLVLVKRKLAYIAIIITFFIAIVGFSFVKQVFFPPATTPLYLIDIWGKKGTDIESTNELVKSIEHKILKLDSVEQVTASVAQGALRFMLTYAPEYYYPEYAQFMVRAENLDKLVESLPLVKEILSTDYPEILFKIKRLEVGPSPAAKVEVRFSGANIDVLKSISNQAMNIFKQYEAATNIRDDLGTPTKVIRPIINEAAARLAGVNKKDIDSLLNMSFEGAQIGVYRNSSDILPIILRTPESERLTINSLSSLYIYSPVDQQHVPIEQFVDKFVVDWEYQSIYRRDRKRTITVMADNDIFGDVTADQLLLKVRGEIEAIDLPLGYSLEWGGDFEASSDAQNALFKSLPLALMVMVVITILLFNSVRATLAIWLSIPFAIIGVTLGLLVGNYSFGFMALLGFLSLSGMMIKNGIVLVDQINVEQKSGKGAFKAVVDAAISRVMPVSMAALTTMLGLIPLLTDDFFSSMAVVILTGLGVATILTLVFVPLFYCSIFKIKTEVT